MADADVFHAEGPFEHSLCGVAFDAFLSGYADSPVVFAKVGQKVTCEECRKHIEFVRKAYRRYTYMGDDSSIA